MSRTHICYSRSVRQRRFASREPKVGEGRGWRLILRLLKSFRPSQRYGKRDSRLQSHYIVTQRSRRRYRRLHPCLKTARTSTVSKIAWILLTCLSRKRSMSSRLDAGAAGSISSMWVFLLTSLNNSLSTPTNTSSHRKLSPSSPPPPSSTASAPPAGAQNRPNAPPKPAAGQVEAATTPHAPPRPDSPPGPRQPVHTQQPPRTQEDKRTLPSADAATVSSPPASPTRALSPWPK